MTFGQHEPACSLHNVAADRRPECFVCRGERAQLEILPRYRAKACAGLPIDNTQASLLIFPATFSNFQALMYESNAMIS